MFNHHDITRDAFMLHGPRAHHGYDWWWHSFTAHDAETGEDKPFYEELLSKNPTEKFTHLVVKHYNHPRENSLTDLVRKGIIHV